MNRKEIVAALGDPIQEGDYLKLENQWAKVFVERQKRYVEIAPRTENVPALCAERVVYVVTGDLTDNVKEKVFSTPSVAMSYAMLSLGYYAQGACR